MNRTPRPLRRAPLLAAVVSGLLLTGCAGALDKAVKKRTIPNLALARDLQVACTFGEVGVAAAATVSGTRSQEALSVAWTMAGLCSELDARDRQLESQAALRNAPQETRAAAATDARLAAARSYARAAQRYQQGYLYVIDAYGDADSCRVRSDADQGVYLLGLMAGILAQVMDGEAGGAVGVPLNQLLDVARATECVDDARWWGIPSGARNAAWATVPGSAPDGVEPWAGLAEAAAVGDASGQGIPRALWLFTAANAGDDELVREILDTWPEPSADVVPEWALLDEYARVVARHEADLLWISEAGHRAPEPMVPPAPAAPAGDPFGSDPFGSDPFGGDDDPFDAPEAPDAEEPEPPAPTE